MEPPPGARQAPALRTPKLPKKVPPGVQALMVTLAGAVLAFGGCGYFMDNFNSTGTWPVFGGIAFVAGALMVVIGGLFALYYLIRWMFS